MKTKMQIGGIVTAIIVLIIGLNSFTIVSTGSEASVESFGKVHEGKILTGFNMVAPWWGIDEYDNLLVTETLEDRGIPSQDKFKTQMDISYTGHFLYGFADSIRGTTGNESKFLTTHVEKKVRSCTVGAGTQVKSSQAFFSQETQAFMSAFVLTCVNEYIESELVGGGYEITQIQFTDITLDPGVRKFMVTTKQRQEAENQQEPALAIADLLAQEAIVKAAANLTASVDDKSAAANVSDAKLYDMQQIAKGNIALDKSISPRLVAYVEVNKWDGARSKIVAGQGTSLLVDIRNGQ